MCIFAFSYIKLNFLGSKLPSENICILYHENVKKAREGKSFYYENKKRDLYLRYAKFRTGDLSALVSSKHSKEKLQNLLAKPKDLWLFHCCGFKVQDFYFRAWNSEGKGSYYQVGKGGKDWSDYNIGTNAEIDTIFLDHQEKQGQRNWKNEVDFELVFNPNFRVLDITSIFDPKIFDLKTDYGTGTGEKRFLEDYLRKRNLFKKNI